MEPNVDRMQWSVVALLGAIVIGGVILLAFPKITAKIVSSADKQVDDAFSGNYKPNTPETPPQVEVGENDIVVTINKPKYDEPDLYKDMLETVKGEVKFKIEKENNVKTLLPDANEIKVVMGNNKGIKKEAKLIKISGTKESTKYKLSVDKSFIDEHQLTEMLVMTDKTEGYTIPPYSIGGGDSNWTNYYNVILTNPKESFTVADDGSSAFLYDPLVKGTLLGNGPGSINEKINGNVIHRSRLYDFPIKYNLNELKDNKIVIDTELLLIVRPWV